MVTNFARRALSGVRVVCALLVVAPPSWAGEPSARASKPGPRIQTRSGDPGARRAIAGGPTTEDVSLGPESPELRSLREAERELFPPASASPGSPWPSELPALLPGDGAPHVLATGLPPGAPLPLRPGDDTGLAWLSHLETPDLPVRWDERVVRYLQYFRDDPRGHATFANLYRKSGRFRELMRRVLRRKSLPEDLVWVAMIESGFDPAARSSAGAAGLWQFMPETAKIYGLLLDRWLDQRLSPPVATEAAAEFLGDLHRRFGSWELALAGYNMGYVGLSSVMRRYNTNDFWSLSRAEGTLPWETTLYVPKIIATAVVAHNLAVFGFSGLAVESAVETDEIEVAPGTPLALVAQAAGTSPKDIEALNPELRAARTPPAGDGDAAYPVKVPQGKGSATAQALARLRKDQPPLDRYVVRFGETLDQVAAAHRVTTQKLVDLNAISPAEGVRGGTVLLVPHVDTAVDPGSAPAVSGSRADLGPAGKPSVVVPADVFVYPGRKRVFYRVLAGDTLREIANALHASTDDLRRWNDLDPNARLQEGMTLQAFVPQDGDLSGVLVAAESDVRVLAVGSDEFFAALEHDKGFRRVTAVAKAGDTIEAIGKRFDVSARTMERINRRPRGDVLKPGEAVVVYVPAGSTADRIVPKSGAAAAVAASTDPAPNGPLPAPPVPDLLP